MYLTPTLEILFWICIFLVFYTFIGYGIILYFLVKLKEAFAPAPIRYEPGEWPEITLFIAAYNEEAIVDAKMENCFQLNYPPQKLKILWITDGSNDKTNEKLGRYPEVSVHYIPQRKGKTAALNRGIQFVETPFVIYTDANTMLNKEAIHEIIKEFSDPRVGCVAGEKRIAVDNKDQAAAGGEGFYWTYESKLKEWDSRLYSAVGAAGELFAIRTSLFEPLPEDTLLDDFILSMRIAQKGYKIAYCKSAYALEKGSADIKNEEKRKVRIAAGGLQSIKRLGNLLIPNPFHLGLLRFQYISHRVLRWSITPIALFLLPFLNIILVWLNPQLIYILLLAFQILFYLLAVCGALVQRKKIKIKILFIPYYFLFMNANVLKAFFSFHKYKGKGTWEKAQRIQE
ncbi:glycosyltransferase family 2 protein [uncultured Odoribacter sp.]|uniref:glycosyltransferase family 2 protein n=1 Tax=uncultured Odoribacter sp. TaxID=876416 RepID=UPI00260E0496|nr:glycosyltransferase family 2 protein [uncultured Odoribacter sp.]